MRTVQPTFRLHPHRIEAMSAPAQDYPRAYHRFGTIGTHDGIFNTPTLLMQRGKSESVSLLSSLNISHTRNPRQRWQTIDPPSTFQVMKMTH